MIPLAGAHEPHHHAIWVIARRHDGVRRFAIETAAHSAPATAAANYCQTGTTRTAADDPFLAFSIRHGSRIGRHRKPFPLGTGIVAQPHRNFQ